MDYKWEQFGDEIKQSVQDAVERGDFSRLNQTVNDSVSRAADAISRGMKNGGWYRDPKANGGRNPDPKMNSGRIRIPEWQAAGTGRCPMEQRRTAECQTAVSGTKSGALSERNIRKDRRRLPCGDRWSFWNRDTCSNDHHARNAGSYHCRGSNDCRYADLRIFLSDLCRNVREGNRDGKPGEPFQKLCESDR